MRIFVSLRRRAQRCQAEKSSGIVFPDHSHYTKKISISQGGFAELCRKRGGKNREKNHNVPLFFPAALRYNSDKEGALTPYIVYPMTPWLLVSPEDPPCLQLRNVRITIIHQNKMKRCRNHD